MPIKWHGNGSGLTKPPSDFVALGRPRGVTGSDLTMSPNDLVAVAYQRVFVGSDTTKAPSDIKQMSKGKPEAALDRTIPCNLA